MKILVFQTTVSSKEAADHLAKSIIDEKLAACVSVAGPVESHYIWEGERQCSAEYVLTIKTLTHLKMPLKAFIHSQHPYDNPEFLQNEVESVLPEYHKWMQENCKKIS